MIFSERDIAHQGAVKEHFDTVAKDYDYWKKKNAYYYDNLKTFIARNVRPGSKVLDVGCGAGDVLHAAAPSVGVGVDLSEQMVGLASEKYPQYQFHCSSIEKFNSDEKFDYILMLDLVDHVYDIVDVFESVYKLCHPGTKIILTTVNPWWDPLFRIMEKFKAKQPEGPHNFIEKRNITAMLEALNFSVAYSGYLMLFPKYIPLLSFLANTIGTRIWGLNKLSVVQYLSIQPLPLNNVDLGYGCSVVIPCYNEEGSIQDAVKSIPEMGKQTEIIVVNDGSTDKTADKVRELLPSMPNLKLVDYSPNRGKGQAVKAGFDTATQDVLMILDADLSVEPHELPRFFKLLNQGKCQFVNGTRLVYPMEKQAMRTLNLLGNKLFSLVLSFIAGQPLTDTLCGTKAFLKKDYPFIPMGADKWGDYDLIFGAAKLGNKIMEVPVHYCERKAGQSKMKRFHHGMHLLKACLKGFQELVFISPNKKRSNA